jgi:hypothetical protein
MKNTTEYKKARLLHNSYTAVAMQIENLLLEIASNKEKTEQHKEEAKRLQKILLSFNDEFIDYCNK